MDSYTHIIKILYINYLYKENKDYFQKKNSRNTITTSTIILLKQY